MNRQTTTIRHFNRRTQVQSSLEVLKINEKTYQLIESDPFDLRYFPGVIIKTKLNGGFHETVEFIKPNAQVERFFLDITQNINDLSFLFEELVKLGGHVQIDMGGILTLTIPDQFPYHLDKVIEDYDIKVIRS